MEECLFGDRRSFHNCGGLARIPIERSTSQQVPDGCSEVALSIKVHIGGRVVFWSGRYVPSAGARLKQCRMSAEEAFWRSDGKSDALYVLKRDSYLRIGIARARGEGDEDQEMFRGGADSPRAAVNMACEKRKG